MGPKGPFLVPERLGHGWTMDQQPKGFKLEVIMRERNGTPIKQQQDGAARLYRIGELITLAKDMIKCPVCDSAIKERHVAISIKDNGPAILILSGTCDEHGFRINCKEL